MKAFNVLLKTETKLNIRDMNMLIFAVAMPLVILLILGFIYGKAPVIDGHGHTFMDQSFAALCSVSLCAGGAMGIPILLSEYRERKIIKRFKVTPVSPALLLLVQIVIYAFYGIVSFILLMTFGHFIFDIGFPSSWVGFIGAFFLTLISIFSIGIFVGGIAKNYKQASVISCLLYFPMLIFSGATLPYEIMPATLQKISDFMPLTQGIKLMKAQYIYNYAQDNLFSVIFLFLVFIIFSTAALRFFKWE